MLDCKRSGLKIFTGEINIMDQLPGLIERSLGLSPEIQTKLLLSLIIFVALLLVRHMLLRLIWSKTSDVRQQYMWKRSLTYIFTVLGIVLLVNIWLIEFRQIGTFIGLLSAGLAVAMKDPLSNIAGWAFILIRKPFNLGDRIQVGDHAGDVIDIRLFQFTLLEIGNWVDADQSTGRIIDIPNGKVFTDVLANFTKGFEYIWHEIPVLVTFESNWEKAKKILEQVAEKHAGKKDKAAQERIREAGKKFLIFYSHLTPIVYTRVKESGVLLTIRYICEPRRRRGMEEIMWENILRQFAQHKDIDFAYPTRRFYNNLLEGKETVKDESDV